jgi:hypothetical protein
MSVVGDPPKIKSVRDILYDKKTLMKIEKKKEKKMYT